MDQYIFGIYFDAFGLKVLGELSCSVHFKGRSHFVVLGSITFWGLFEGLNDVLWGLNFYAYATSCDSTLRYLSNDQRITSNLVCMRKLCLMQVDLSSWPPWYRLNSASTLISHTCGANHLWTFKNIIGAPKTYPWSRVRICKNPKPNPRWLSRYVKYWATR